MRGLLEATAVPHLLEGKDMVQYITAIWVGAGCAAVAGTAWLMVASKLGKRPFRRSDLIPAKLSGGEFHLVTPVGIISGKGDLNQALEIWERLNKGEA